MKSSSTLKLTIMLSATATVTGCSEQPHGYTSIAECAEHGQPENLCRSAYDEALAEHIRTAPRFDTSDECLAKLDVDRCIGVPLRQGDGQTRYTFAPLMLGFLVNPKTEEKREREGGTAGAGGGYAYNRRLYYGSPIYRSRAHSYGFWSSAELATSTSPSATPRSPNIRTATVARLGFGGRSGSGES